MVGWKLPCHAVPYVRGWLVFSWLDFRLIALEAGRNREFLEKLNESFIIGHC